MIYFDNNATTPLHPEVLEYMSSLADVAYGNPGSPHRAGRRARQCLEEARESVARILDCQPDEVAWTSGGTESSNLALQGLVQGRSGSIVLPGGEHPATAETVRRLVQSGRLQPIELPLDPSGKLVPEAVADVDLRDAVLATALLAHNETGVIQDLSLLSTRCRETGVPLHVDAVQAVGKIPVSFRQLDATTLSAAAHKFHGPRGVGVLLVRRDCRLQPLLRGGYQERGLRPGTEPVLLAAGMARALELWHQEQEQRTSRVSSLRDRLEAGLIAGCSPCVVNGDRDSRLSNTLHLSFPGCAAEALLVALDLQGVCCSLGSACASGSLEPSPVLLAMGLPEAVVRSAVRFSLAQQNTEAEVDEAISIISEVVRRLRSG